MKKFLLSVCLVAGTTLAWAGDVQLTEENFLSWVKAQTIAGFEVDEESFENYDNREFTIDFMTTGAPSHLSIKVEGRGALAEIKAESQVAGNSALAEYTEATVNGNKAAYYTMPGMKNVSFMYVELPQIDGELRLLTSPKKSVGEMRDILAGLDLKGLK
jgi:hypothetical protein